MKNKQKEIPYDKYDKIITTILKNEKLQVHEKLIELCIEASKYKIIKNKKI